MAPLLPLALSCLLSLAAAGHASTSATTDTCHETSTKSQSKGHSTSHKSCSTTITHTKIVSRTSTSVVSTYTIAQDADVINGDDFGITNPLSSEIITSTVGGLTEIDSTSTYVVTSTPTTTVGTVVTVHQPTPAGFIPIKDSLPSGTYIPYTSTASRSIPGLKGRDVHHSTSHCKATTITKTKTTAINVTSTSTTTLTGTVLAFPEEGTAFELSDFKNPKTLTYVTTYISEPRFTTTATVLASTTITVTATTTTIYAACATTNFANYVRQPNGTNFAIRSISHEDFVSPQPLYLGPEDCCAIALNSGAAAWAWVGYGLGNGCYTVANTEGSCEEGGTSVTAFVEAEITDFDITPIYGNGYCGKVDASAPFVNITGNPGGT